VTTPRWDETWHRLREWTAGSSPSERLAAQLLLAEGFAELDPSHPLGGPDGGKDAICKKDGAQWVMAVYFPRGQRPFAEIKWKFLDDLEGAKRQQVAGFAFVTNQELALAERRDLVTASFGLAVELFHLERITAILDGPALASVRKQFLGIDFNDGDTVERIERVRAEVLASHRRLEALQTGGDSFCYFMLYHFDLDQAVAKNIVVIRKGEYPLYDLRIRVTDLDSSRDVLNESWGEMNSPADFKLDRWSLAPRVYYRVAFHARNGNWNQDLILNRSDAAGCWLAATRVRSRDGRATAFSHVDREFEAEFGAPVWRT
jgi:hypothetical protein